jgi:hypothetical protein
MRGPAWPPAPEHLRPLTSTRERERRFGKFTWKPAPTPSNPERIVITDGWGRTNLVRVSVPQLVKGKLRKSPQLWVHREIADAFVALWAAWEQHGLLNRVRSFHGTYVARLVRGGSTLSNHAFGTAFDINARDNRLGTIPALVGERGSVRELVPLANAHGFFWGGHFTRRLDGMHFEAGRR